MLRQAQHERSCLIRFANRSVRPEPVEGQAPAVSLSLYSHSSSMLFLFIRIFSLEDRYCPRRNERMESNDKSFPKLLGVNVPRTDFDQRAVTLIHRGLISGHPQGGGICREKRLTKHALLTDIAADFALLRLRCSRIHRRKSRQFT